MKRTAMNSNKTSLPKSAKRVFKGIIFDVYQWEQKMYDGSFETFEKLKRPDTAVMIATVGEKILIQEQEQPGKPGPFLSLPGGRIEKGEHPLDGAKRELLEETGYASEDWELWKEFSPFSKTVWTVFIYIARNCHKKTGQTLDAGEKISLKFMSFEEFLMLSENEMFYERELVPFLYKFRLHPDQKEAFKKLLFKRRAS